MKYARILALAVVLAGCSAATAPPPAKPRPWSPLGDIYFHYIDAIERDDLASADQYVSAGKKKYLDILPPAEALAAIDVVSPKSDIEPFKELVRGSEATLILRGKVAENVATGRVDFVREDGAWKIISEAWDVGTPPEASGWLQAPGDDTQRTEAQKKALQRLHEQGYAMPAPDYMVMAATTGDLEALKLFLEAGYPIDLKVDGRTALVSAAMFGHTDVVLFLIGAGADVNVPENGGITALMRIADKCDTTEAVRALLKAGARTDGVTPGGATALQLAQWSHCEENARLIREAATNPAPASRSTPRR